MSDPWRVLGCRGCGSAIVEAALAIAGIPYDREEVDYGSAAGRARLAPYNPLAQVPTVLLPDGGVMTESAAIVLHIAELAPDSKLMPPPGDPLRRDALRWLTFIVAAIYPTFTYGDTPEKWTPSGKDELRRSTDEHRQAMFREIEKVTRAPWFLGSQLSALDLYIAVMVHWRPRQAWFAEHCPRLSAIGVAVATDPRLAGVWKTNFD
jgi:GST-like protein